MIRGGTDKRNITVWEPGTVGGEYIKAYGHYHVGDLNEMERHIRRLLDDRGEARAMGQRARVRLNEFSTERCVTRFEEIVESATFGGGQARAAEPAFGGAGSR